MSKNTLRMMAFCHEDFHNLLLPQSECIAITAMQVVEAELRHKRLATDTPVLLSGSLACNTMRAPATIGEVVHPVGLVFFGRWITWVFEDPLGTVGLLHIGQCLPHFWHRFNTIEPVLTQCCFDERLIRIVIVAEEFVVRDKLRGRLVSCICCRVCLLYRRCNCFPFCGR